MLGKKSNPVIEILTESLVSSHISSIFDFATSPRSHMESKAQSPRGLFDYGGLGLGIVAALENSGGGQNEIPANKALLTRNLSRSNPIPVNSQNYWGKKRDSEKINDIESFEEYSVVTCHGPNKSYTKVYSDGGRKGDNRTPFRIQNNRSSIFHISPVRSGEVAGVPPVDFLSLCDLCKKKLHGKDIYMYRGERAFCSTECRYKQIVMDERTDKCSSEASRPVDVSNSGSSSNYANEQILTTGILAI